MMTRAASAGGAPSSRRAAIAGTGILAASVACIAVITLTPVTGTARLPFWCFRCGSRPGIDVLLNILLFVPLGVALGILRVRFALAAAAIVTATMSVEALQFALPIGRFPSVRDILTNTTGGLVGVWLALAWRPLLRPPPRRALALGITAAGAWISIQAFTAWAMLLVAPAPPWWAQIRLHDLGFSERFDGEVVSASSGALPIMVSDRLEESEAVRRQLLDGAPLRVAVTGAGPIDGHAPILMLATDDALSEIAALVQVGDDVFFRIRTRASTLGLRSPGVRLERVFGEQWVSDTMRVAASFRDGRYRLASERNGVGKERVLAASPSWTWALLMPIPHYSFGQDVRFVTAGWLFAVFWVMGFWIGRHSASRHAVPRATAPIIILILTTCIAGLAIVPLIAGLPVSHWSEWVASVAGGSAGWFFVRHLSSSAGRGSTHSPAS